jgi:hypothetical protein
MYRFFRHFDDKYLYAAGSIGLDDLPRQEPALYSEADLAFERSLLEAAVARTEGDALIQGRLAKVMRYFIAHELWARAVYEPQRLFFSFRGDGINRDALAFYLNDDGARLKAAMDYYLTKRTLPPDTNVRNRQLGVFESLIAGYTRGKEAVLDAIRGEAFKWVDLASADRRAADAVVERALAVLHDHMPDRFLPAQRRQFEGILKKTIVIPRVAETPVIDGEPGDAVWAKGAVLDGFTERDTLADTPHPTTGRVLNARSRLCFALTCKQAGPIHAWTAKEVATGGLSWKESGVEFFFGKTQTADGKTPFAQYMVNSLGAFEGYAAARHNREGVEFAVKVHPDQGLYVIEAALPLKAEGYDFTAEKALSFNLMRKVNTRIGGGKEDMPDSVSGWFPIFLTPHKYSSRGIVFME